MRKVIFDCDTGTDDTVALMLLVLSKKFDIAGITCVWGNQKVEDTTDNTLRVLDFIGSDLKVYKGCERPINPEAQARREASKTQGPIYYTDESGMIHHLHPQHLWIPETKRKAEDKHAVDFIIDTCLNSKEKVTIIPVGPATNVGTAFLKAPEIARNIEEVVFMGGGVNRGNVTSTAEANFFHDPDAVKAILDSGVKCTMAALDATMAASFPVTWADELIESGNERLKLFGEIIKWRADVECHLGWLDGKNEPVHDPMAVAYLIDDSFVKVTRDCECTIDISDTISAGTLLLDTGVGNKDVHILIDAYTKDYFDLICKTIA